MTPPPTEPGHPDPTPPDPALDDPMLRVLRERHPGVDVVVLPQKGPAPLAPVVATDERDDLAAGAERLVDDLLARLPLGDHTPARDGRWHTDEWDQSWYEAVAVLGDLGAGENVALLRSTGHALVALGWQARPVPGERPRLVARGRGGVEAAATVRPTSLVVTLRTAKVRAAEEDAG